MLILTAFTILVLACIIDTSVVKLSVYLGSSNSYWNVMLFSIITLTYTVGQYVILRFVENRFKISETKIMNRIFYLIVSSQYVVISLLVVIVSEMVLTSTYNILLLKAIVTISCLLASMVLALLAKKFLSWYRLNHEVIVLSYGLAVLVLSVNIVFMMTTVLFGLTPHPDLIKPIASPVSIINNANNIYNLIYVISSILSFILLWIATVMLLRYYSKRIGHAKYWIIVISPLLYFLSQFQVTFLSLFEPFRISEPILFGIIFTLVFTMSKPLGGVMFGVAFWVVSRRIPSHEVKHYLILSGFGVTLLLASNVSTNLIFTPYPPFGLIATSIIALAAYMYLIGIYSTAVSISRDSELRKFIYNVTSKEIKLLEHIGFAQVEQELVTRVIPLVHSRAKSIEEETGVKMSLTDDDYKRYLSEVLKELNSNEQKGEM